MTVLPPPPSLALEPGWAHIFRLALDVPPPRLDDLRAHLAADEQQRAARFHFEVDRQHFIAARGQLRQVLAAYLGQEPEALRFDYNQQGKPSLAGTRLRFNLSHTRSLGLLAVADGQELGIDVEGLERKVETLAIARRFFAPAEVAALFALPPAAQPRAFFDCWTRKEAYIKARGGGLSIPLDSFEVGLQPGQPPTLRAPDPGWHIYAIDAGQGFTAALVAQGALAGLRCWDWK